METDRGVGVSGYPGWEKYVPKPKRQEEVRARRTRTQVHGSPTAALNQPIAATVPLFSTLCVAAGLPMPIAEYRFAPPRRWRFDYCWPDLKLALEVQGGIFTRGRHTRGAALLREHEKLNAAAALGYRVLFVTPQQLQDGEAVRIAREAIGQI
jgi:hypothetical protein